MGLLEIRDALIAYWRDNWTTTPTEYQNSKFPDELKLSPYVTFEIAPVNSKTVISGNGSESRYWGNIHVTIRVPVSSGNRVAYELANEITDLLARKRIGSIVTRVGFIDPLPSPREQFGMLVSIPFHTSV